MVGGDEALIVVEPQNDFTEGGALPAPNASDAIKVINRVIPLFRHVIASKDWHPPDHCSFAKWPVHCIAGTAGAEFHFSLDQRNIRAIIHTGVERDDDEYSVFENTHLEAMLKADGIKRVYITGFVLDVCVYETAVSAVALGFDTYIILDATKPAYPDQLEETMAKIRKAAILVTNSADLLTRSE
jgi:nicotinamidase/pyrazinamidase